METFPEVPFKMMKARIVRDDERQVMEVLGGAGEKGGWGGEDHEIAVFG